MITSKRLAIPVAAIALALVAVAGASATTAATNPPPIESPASTEPIPSPPKTPALGDNPTTPVGPSDLLSEPQSSETLGTSLEPAPPETLAVDPSTAQKNLESVFGSLPVEYTAKLALYSNSTYGEIQKDGSVIPTYTKALVWAFVSDSPYAGADAASGPVGQKASSASSPPTGTICHSVLLADAKTGAYLMGYTSCPVGDES